MSLTSRDVRFRYRGKVTNDKQTVKKIKKQVLEVAGGWCRGFPVEYIYSPFFSFSFTKNRSRTKRKTGERERERERGRQTDRKTKVNIVTFRSAYGAHSASLSTGFIFLT